MHHRRGEPDFTGVAEVVSSASLSPRTTGRTRRSSGSVPSG
jgi:hypothetical protein